MTDGIEEWLAGGPGLRRVYEINQRVTRADGGVTTAVSLEVWDDKVRLIYARSVVDQSMPEMWQEHESWTLDDGHGTEFKMTGGSGGGDGVYWHANVTWAPRPHNDAAHLVIRSDVVGIDANVDLY